MLRFVAVPIGQQLATWQLAVMALFIEKNAEAHSQFVACNLTNIPHASYQHQVCFADCGINTLLDSKNNFFVPCLHCLCVQGD